MNLHNVWRAHRSGQNERTMVKILCLGIQLVFQVQDDSILQKHMGQGEGGVKGC